MVSMIQNTKDVALFALDCTTLTISTEDHYFRLDLNHNVHYGIASILQEIWGKQQNQVQILPIENSGHWKLVYADGWKFGYKDYERLATTECG